MKRLALACACAATLSCAAQVHAQIGSQAHQPPGAGSRADGRQRDDDQDRRFGPAYFPRPLYVPPPPFRPGPTESHMPFAHPSFQASRVGEFHPPAGITRAAGKPGPWALRGIGAAIAVALGGLFGGRRKGHDNR